MLSAHSEQNNLLFDYQFGFRKKRSTTLAILDFVNRITDSIDDGGTSIGVFLDLSKAFDTVNHDIILDKLSYYGINNETKDWFSSYLKNCKQYICVDRVNSNFLPLEYGVPQGSVLGPILFLIYLNDAQFVTNIIHLVLYADDMNFLVSYKSLKKIHNGPEQRISPFRGMVPSKQAYGQSLQNQIYPFWLQTKTY